MVTRRQFARMTALGFPLLSAVSVQTSGSNTMGKSERRNGVSKAKLLEVMGKAGKPLISIDGSTGSSILISPYGGRILGLYSSETDENFLWTNPALEEPGSAGAFIASSEWQNLGGDRTWMAPETSFFFPAFPNFKEYAQPRQLDPGDYQHVSNESGVSLQNELRLQDYRSNLELQLRITKSIQACANPLRRTSDEGLAALEFAGYSLRSNLELIGSESALSPVGLWNLLQLPHGGAMVVPTYSRSEARVYFGVIPEGDLVTEDRSILYRMTAEGEQKIGVSALAVTGRAGYLYRSGEDSVLVVRNFRVNPSGEYVDVPNTDLNDMGYVFQACNVNSKLGSFSELEYHAPAIGGRTGLSRCEDTTEVWAFRGKSDTIHTTASLLLSANLNAYKE